MAKIFWSICSFAIILGAVVLAENLIEKSLEGEGEDEVGIDLIEELAIDESTHTDSLARRRGRCGSRPCLRGKICKRRCRSKCIRTKGRDEECKEADSIKINGKCYEDANCCSPKSGSLVGHCQKSPKDLQISEGVCDQCLPLETACQTKEDKCCKYIFKPITQNYYAQGYCKDDGSGNGTGQCSPCIAPGTPCGQGSSYCCPSKDGDGALEKCSEEGYCPVKPCIPLGGSCNDLQPEEKVCCQDGANSTAGEEIQCDRETQKCTKCLTITTGGERFKCRKGIKCCEVIPKYRTVFQGICFPNSDGVGECSFCRRQGRGCILNLRYPNKTIYGEEPDTKCCSADRTTRDKDKCSNSTRTCDY